MSVATSVTLHHILSLKNTGMSFLVAQWVKDPALSLRGLGWIPGPGTSTCHKRAHAPKGKCLCSKSLVMKVKSLCSEPPVHRPPCLWWVLLAPLWGGDQDSHRDVLSGLQSRPFH